MLIPLRHHAKPAAARSDVAAEHRANDGLSRLTLTSTQGIEVEEIGQVEFIREWARAITRAALAQPEKRREAADDVGDAADRLPHSSP